MPIEIAAASSDVATTPRIFRLAAEIGPDQIVLAEGLPEALDWPRGELRLGFHLPGDPATTLRCSARAEELVDGRGTEHERASLRALRFIALAPELAQRIEAYVDVRLA